MFCRRPAALGLLTLAAFLEVSSLSRAEEITNPPAYTVHLVIPDRPGPVHCQPTNSAFVVFIRFSLDADVRAATLVLEPRDDASLAVIIQKVGTARAESGLTSRRVLTEDALIYLNHDPGTLKKPEDLLAGRGAAFFRRTATESFGDYMDAKYQYLGGWLGFVRETFLADPFEKRIVSPLSPAFAGDPGTADTEAGGIHVGLRNLASANPRAFVTLSDKAEFDASINNPSLVLRNPFNWDHGQTLVTAIGVANPDWNVRRWSLPTTGATLAYIHGHFSCNLVASAGQLDVPTGNGQSASRYGEEAMFYARYTF